MRQCGACQLCCKLVPVRELGKGAGVRCQHQQAGHGCKIYHHQTMPMSCRLWTCRWLVADDTRDLARPDRSHYVVDVMPDFVVAQDGPGAEPIKVGAIQVWVDPDYRDAHRDPALRAYLERRAEEGIVAIIRYGASEGFTLVAPAMSGDGQWHELASGVEQEHTVEQLLNLEKAVHVA